MTKNLAQYHVDLENKVALLEETISSMQNVILNLTGRVQYLESLHNLVEVSGGGAGATGDDPFGDGGFGGDDPFGDGGFGGDDSSGPSIEGDTMIGGNDDEVIWG